MTPGPEINPRKLARIARWEVSRSATSVSRKTLVLVAALAVVGVVAGPAVVADGVTLEEGIYRVGVDEDSPFHEVVERNPQFVAGEPSLEALRDGEIEVLVRGTLVQYRSTQKGRAAHEAFRSAIESYNDVLMDREEDGRAAFPVQVQIEYESRASAQAGFTGGGGGGGGGGLGGGGGGGGGTGDGGAGGPIQVPAIGGGGTSVGTPSSISPPFPFGSLVLAFLFIIPMNFVIQAYGSSIMDERINRRGELMLVTPVSKTDIVAGKTLPYLLVLLAITVAIAAFIGGGPLSVAAVAPIALVFLAATFVGAMFARSFKELTFVTLAVSVFLTSYAFVPAIFTEITPLALISPLTLVVRDLQGQGVGPLQYAFSAGPFLLTGVVLFALGAGIYREEDMFTQRPVHLKALDALAARVHRARSVALVSTLSIPFVFVAELLAVALLFALPTGFSVPVLLFLIAGIEEVAKSAHVLAGFEYARFDRTPRTAILVGTLSGLGFFVGEKLMLVAQVVGFQNLELGTAVVPEAAAADINPVVALLLLLAPLALHTVTASISALGARRGPRDYLAALFGAVLVHLAYNMVVIQVAG